MEKQLKIVLATAKSAAISLILIAAITIAAELVPPLKNWLKSSFSHHWIGKSIIALGFFIIVAILSFFYPEKPDVDKITTWLRILLIVAVSSFLAITGFFAYEAFLAA